MAMSVFDTSNCRTALGALHEAPPARGSWVSDPPRWLIYTVRSSRRPEPRWIYHTTASVVGVVCATPFCLLVCLFTCLLAIPFPFLNVLDLQSFFFFLFFFLSLFIHSFNSVLQPGTAAIHSFAPRRLGQGLSLARFFVCLAIPLPSPVDLPSLKRTRIPRLFNSAGLDVLYPRSLLTCQR